MPIISLITQPATDALQAAYRPVIFLVRASRTDGNAIPPVVYCDIYVNGAYYKTLQKTQYKVLNSTNSDWQFDIQDACQEVLIKVLGSNGGNSIITANGVMLPFYCKFRSSGFNTNGFIAPEGTAPLQATGTNIATAGSGTQSHSFFVVNSTLQHEHNQDLASHLNAYKTRTWASNAWPLSHRKDLYKVGYFNSDYFPIIYTGAKALRVRLKFKSKGASIFTTKDTSGGGGGGGCGLVVSSVSVTDYSSQGGGNHLYDVTFSLSGTGVSFYDVLTSIDGGSTWQNANILFTNPGEFVYSMSSLDPVNHIIKIIPYCAPGSAGTSGQANYVAGASVGCIPVSIPGGVSLPDGIEGQPYLYSFSFNGDAPFILTSIVKPVWMTVSYGGSTVTFAGTPDAQGTDLSVSFTVTNCSGTGSTTFADAIDIRGVPSLTLTSNTVSGSGLFKVRTQTFDVGPSVSSGNRYQLICYGHIVEVTAVSGDTPTTIATKLSDAVNATTATQWNDQGQNPGLADPTSPSHSGNQLSTLCSSSVQFSSATYIS